MTTFEISMDQNEDEMASKSAYEAQLREIVGRGYIDYFSVDLEGFDFKILKGTAIKFSFSFKFAL